MDSEELEFLDVWQQASDQDQIDVAAFWKEHGAIENDAAIAARLPELCVLVRDAAGQLMAVSTAYEEFNQRLNNRFYAMRMFVGPDARRSQIGFRLIHKIIETLESRFKAGQCGACIGVVFELENEAIKKARTEAIWPTTGFVYVGNNARGDHVRVRYFEGARIA